jgi:hypothetical protein
MMLYLVGVWRLLELYALAEGTGERIDLLGKDPNGYAVFEPGGRMIAIATATNRTTGRSVVETAELFLSMAAYSGKWSVEGEKFITVVDVAWEPSWVGTSQIRYYAFDGKILSLRTDPIELPAFPGRKAIAYADWEREG